MSEQVGECSPFYPPLAWEDTCLVTEMTPGGTLAHIYQLTSTDQVSYGLLISTILKFKYRDYYDYFYIKFFKIIFILWNFVYSLLFL